MPGKSKEGMPAEVARPAIAQLDKEIRRREMAYEYRSAVYGVVRVLIVFAAAAVLISTLWLPIFTVQQGSMTPTLRDGDMMIFVTTGSIKNGDVVAFHHNNQILMKRVIAKAGEWVDISQDGIVSVDKKPVEELYVNEFTRGVCNIDLPVFVPDRQFFVMGDNRVTSLDSRTSEIGMVHRDQIAGKALLRVWPLSRFGFIQ